MRVCRASARGKGLHLARSEHGKASLCKASSQQHAGTPASIAFARALLEHGAAWWIGRRAGQLAAAQRRWKGWVAGRGRGRRGWRPLVAGRRRERLRLTRSPTPSEEGAARWEVARGFVGR